MPPDIEHAVVVGESGADAVVTRLVALATKLRALDTLGLAEVPSTRLLVNTARLIRSGMPPRAACSAGLVVPFTDDTEIAAVLRDLVALVF